MGSFIDDIRIYCQKEPKSPTEEILFITVDKTKNEVVKVLGSKGALEFCSELRVAQKLLRFLHGEDIREKIIPSQDALILRRLNKRNYTEEDEDALEEEFQEGDNASIEDGPTSREIMPDGPEGVPILTLNRRKRTLKPPLKPGRKKLFMRKMCLSEKAGVNKRKSIPRRKIKQKADGEGGDDEGDQDKESENADGTPKKVRRRKNTNNKIPIKKRKKFSLPSLTDVDNLVCELCDLIFVGAYDFKRHLPLHESEERNKFTCTFCSVVSNSDKEYNEHLIQVHFQNFPCQQCSTKFGCRMLLKDHMCRDHNVSKSQLRRVKSHSNDKQLRIKSPYTIITTSRKVHSENSSAITDIKFASGPVREDPGPNRNPTDDPVASSSSAEGAGTGGGVDGADDDGSSEWVCHYCGQKYKSKSGLQYHLKRHEKPATCQICGKLCNGKKALELHLLVHSDEKTHMCELCGKCFKQFPSLYTHMNVHREGCWFPCQHCSESFRSKAGYKYHMLLMHKEEAMKKNWNIFTCEFCQKEFTAKHQHRRHMAVHTGNKPYKCEICQHAYSQKGDLNRHLKSHSTKTRRHACYVCHLQFWDLNKIRKHIGSKRHNENCKQKNVDPLGNLREFEEKVKKKGSNRSHEGQVTIPADYEGSEFGEDESSSTSISQPDSSVVPIAKNDNNNPVPHMVNVSAPMNMYQNSCAREPMHMPGPATMMPEYPPLVMGQYNKPMSMVDAMGMTKPPDRYDSAPPPHPSHGLLYPPAHYGNQ